MTFLARLQEQGIRRVGSKERGFRYVSADGKAVPAAVRARIQALKLPPAWKDVRINPNPRGHLAAIGKDKAGRWQYRYHAAFREKQETKKYDRLVEFAEALPKMRATVDRHLRQRGLGREKVMACALKILSTCFIRPGSRAYAAENGSYGLATLRRSHVTVTGDRVQFSFPGKSGQHQERELQDARVARIVRQLMKTTGVEVFKYVDEDGKIVDVRRRDINEYIKRVMGEPFSAKDFRTWAGTLIAASALARVGAHAGENERSRKKKVVAAVKEAAEILGNTPAICRASYIYPSVLSSFHRGRTVAAHFQKVEDLEKHRGRGLHRSERALVDLLEKGGGAKRGAARRARRVVKKVVSTQAAAKRSRRS